MCGFRRVGTVYVPTRTNLSFPRNRNINAITPIPRINTLLNVTMKRRIRPLADLPAISVFHRVEMDVIHMPGKIDFIAYLMLPIPALPQCRFQMLLFRHIDPFGPPIRFATSHAHLPFDHAPTGCIIPIFNRAMSKCSANGPATTPRRLW